MRQLRSGAAEVAGVAFVAFFAVFALLVGLDARSDTPRPVVGADARVGFLRAWEASRNATFSAATVFTREGLNGSSLRFEGTQVQRPPDELVIGFGVSELRLDDQVASCVPAEVGAAASCTDLRPGTPFQDRVAEELATLEGYFAEPTPRYVVTDRRDGCFRLDQAAAAAIAPYGRSATFCFDALTDALSTVEIVYDQGVVERTTLTGLTPLVTDDQFDLVPPG